MPIEPNESPKPVERMMSAEEREAMHSLNCGPFCIVCKILSSHDICERELHEAQARLEVLCEPGTPIAIVNGMFDLAQEKCGHDPTSSRHALVTIEEWVDQSRAALLAIRLASRGTPGQIGSDSAGDCNLSDCHCSNHLARQALASWPFSPGAQATIAELRRHRAKVNMSIHEALDWLNGIGDPIERIKKAKQALSGNPAMQATAEEKGPICICTDSKGNVLCPDGCEIHSRHNF